VFQACAVATFHEKAGFVKAEAVSRVMFERNLGLVSIRTLVEPRDSVHAEVLHQGWCCNFDIDLVEPI
jgi:collagenase-like PrtC family protease